MKTLIVYYSLDGNTEYVANKIAVIAEADTLRLLPKKAYKDKGVSKFLWGGKSAVMGESPALEPYDIDLAKYETVVFGFPVWASRFAPPLRTFIQDNFDNLKGKRFLSFACQSGSGAEKAFAKLEELLEASLKKTVVFIDPKDKASKEKDEKISQFGESMKA